jgi:hypothetical protein
VVVEQEEAVAVVEEVAKVRGETPVDQLRKQTNILLIRLLRREMIRRRNWVLALLHRLQGHMR